jgi:hypothetical protein
MTSPFRVLALLAVSACAVGSGDNGLPAVGAPATPADTVNADAAALMAVTGPVPKVTGTTYGVWLSSGDGVRLQVREDQVVVAVKCPNGKIVGGPVAAQVTDGSLKILEAFRVGDASCSLKWAIGATTLRVVKTGKESDELSLSSGIAHEHSSNATPGGDPAAGAGPRDSVAGGLPVAKFSKIAD